MIKRVAVNFSNEKFQELINSEESASTAKRKLAEAQEAVDQLLEEVLKDE